MADVIEYIRKYLIYERTDEYKEWFSDDESYEDITRPSFDQYASTRNLNQSLFWKGEELPWQPLTCLAVVNYVVKLNMKLNRDLYKVINRLNWIALYYHAALRDKAVEESQLKIRETFSSYFVNTFIPITQKFFKVPKLNEVLYKDMALKENEILAGFLDFLLQILNSQALCNSNEEHRYGVLPKELTFILSILGDMPFRYTELEQVNNILGEIESLANEAGNFIYSCVFTLHPVMDHIFYEGQCAVSEMAEILNIKIKEHCSKFSVQNSSVISRTNEVIDSIFIVDSLIEDLENMMNYQTHLIVDELNVQIRTLQDELKISRSLLKDIRMPHDAVHMVELNESIMQVRDVAYEAEYLVNSYVVGNLHSWYFNLRLPLVISKFKLIRTRLQEVKAIHDIEVLDIKKDFGRELRTETLGTPSTKTIDTLVGFENEIANLSNDLLGIGKNRHIITIFGMPGVGKTTIANKLYNDRSVIDHFDERGYCVVSQTYQKRKVLIDILMSLSKSKTEKNSVSQMEDDDVSLKIYQCLKKRRYIVIVDDVWSTNVWDDLERFFPDDGNGSRIMITSRIRGVSPPNSIVHSLSLLTEEQSWRLLEWKMFHREECPPQLQSIGKRIAAKCGGLPLTIVVTSGVLINLDNEESIWEKVEKNLDSYIFSNGTNEYYSKILELSFRHLPNHLKMCFLYVGTFPEDSLIPIKKLMRLWISEGFIQREEGKSRELVAEEYLKDLINRSLVLIAERKHDGRIKACSIHDQLREMCSRISHQENFSKSEDNRGYVSIYEKHRRVFNNNKNASESFGLYNRSFSGYLQDSSSRLPQMKLLRVMDLLPDPERSNFELKRVDLQVQLRYLAVNQMPIPINDNFVNLEFLVIQSDEVIKIPLVILKLVKLRHLDTGDAIFEDDCYSCRSTNLKYFSSILIWRENDNEILRCSPHLHKLSCFYYNPTLFPDLYSHHDLQILILHFYCDFSGELTKVNFPSTISNLTLSNLGLPWEEISIIGRLPNLQVLKLAWHAFVGEEWETRDGEFQELRHLGLYLNDTIKRWITCSEHFPQLECLVVSQCINLKEIPSEIGDIPTLQWIKVHDNGDGAYKSAIKIVEEQRDQYGNELLQLETSNEEKLKDLIQGFQQHKLEKEEFRLKYGF